METQYELKLSNGQIVSWAGNSGESAAMRYVDMFRDTTVIAWRPIQHGVFNYNHNIRIIEE